MPSFLNEFMDIWSSGGWLMLPLFVLTIFIYYTALELFIRLNTHFLIRSGIHRFADDRISNAAQGGFGWLSKILTTGADSAEEVRRHFQEVRNEYLPVFNRRIRFLAIIIGTGPLMGLLGTVMGMLTTFDGMAQASDSKFESIVSGISEALITTQAGLIISIPAFVILSLIIQRRNTLERCISRLEQYNIRMAIRKCA